MSLTYIESSFVNEIVNNINNFGLPETFTTTNHIKYPGAPFTTPNNHPWLSLHLSVTGIVNVDANNYMDNVVGIFNIQVNFPNNSGSVSCTSVADRIRFHFHNNYSGGVVVEEVAGYPANSEDWITINVKVSYRFEQINSASTYL